MTTPGGSGGTLTAAFTYSFEEPFTVTPSTDAVDAGGRMSVSWTARGLERATGSPCSGWEEATTTTGGITRMARRPARGRSLRRRGRGSTSSATYGRRFSRRGAQQPSDGTMNPARTFRSRRSRPSDLLLIIPTSFRRRDVLFENGTQAVVGSVPLLPVRDQPRLVFGQPAKERQHVFLSTLRLWPLAPQLHNPSRPVFHRESLAHLTSSPSRSFAAFHCSNVLTHSFCDRQTCVWIISPAASRRSSQPNG
jgi:hypothetical protein